MQLLGCGVWRERETGVVSVVDVGFLVVLERYGIVVVIWNLKNTHIV